MKDDMDSLKELLDKRKDPLIDIQSKLSSAGAITGFDITIIPLPSVHFTTIRISINNLREKCESLLQPVKNQLKNSIALLQ